MSAVPARSPSAHPDGGPRRHPQSAADAAGALPAPRDAAEHVRADDLVEPEWVSAIDAATD
jgi:hypothetical protein